MGNLPYDIGMKRYGKVRHHLKLASICAQKIISNRFLNAVRILEYIVGICIFMIIA